MYRNSNGSTDQLSYRAQARIFLRKSSEYLEKGDFTQASANGWGAVVEALKALATEREWNHYGTKSLYDIMDRLVEETGDQDMKSLFASAGQLDTNFYENWLSRTEIESHLADAARLVTKLERLMDKEPG